MSEDLINELRKMTPKEYEDGFYSEMRKLGIDTKKGKIEYPNGEIVTVEEFLKRNRGEWYK